MRARPRMADDGLRSHKPASNQGILAWVDADGIA